MLELINFTDLNDEQKMMVFDWRNDERVAKFMRSKNISLNEHLKFIDSLKTARDKIYFLVRENDEFIGVIDFIDISDRECEFGLYANPRLKGQGKTLMHTVLAYAFRILKVKEINARVFNENEKAMLLYLNFGFLEVKNDKEFVFLRLKNEGDIVQIVMKNYKFLTDSRNKEILTIRNLEYIKNMSLNNKIINFDEHKKRLESDNE